jgi:hypothetical protein
MNYRQLVEEAVKSGSGEKAMWASVDVTNELMEHLEHQHPDLYEHYMRKSYETIHGKHYNRYFAEEDVSKLHSTDKEGKEHHGAYWTLEQIKEATAGKKFQAGVTDWDKFVAYNAAWHDFCKKFTDEEILCIAWLFFFADEDWKGDSKVWDYMAMNR